MKIVFSQHSRDQNRFRKISLSEAKQTIINPDDILDSYKNRKLRRKTFKNKTLEVVTITEGSIITVITFYYLGVEDENII